MAYERMRVPKVSKDHQGFAGTFTHMDGNDEEEKEKKESFMMCYKKNIRNSSGFKTQQTDKMTLNKRTQSKHHAYIQNKFKHLGFEYQCHFS